MKKMLILVSMLLAMGAQATTISELFDALKKQPTSKLDQMNEQMANTAIKKVESNYYPKVDLFTNITHYNSATNLLPVDPLTAGKLIAQGKDLPFAKTIGRYGIKISVPVFVKELSDLSEKAKYMTKGAKLKKRLNFYKNEAVILGANAGLEYIYHLEQTLKATKKSIEKTKSDMQIAVDNGRMPGIAIDKIDEKLNQLEIAINNVHIKKISLISKIQSLTNIALTNYTPMELVSQVKKDHIFALKPLQEIINASKSDLKASKAKRYYPKVGANVFWSENYAPDAVNTGDDVHRSYGYYQLGLSLPLYDKTSDTDIQLKQIALMKDKMKLEKTKIELESEAKRLANELSLLKKSEKLTKENIAKKEDLLKFAKVATKEGRMSEEDYLRYEDGLLSANSNYYQIKSQIWQNIAKLAVIYGNDLRSIVK
ncbi:TolC family protein [Sulfurospirillum sp. 1307]